MTARLTFGLPVYNGEQFLAEAIESVLAQTFTDVRLVISDNASTDGTREICLRAAERDPRVTYVRAPVNGGGDWNFRRVWELADTELFTWICADDVKTPDFAHACVAALDDAGDDAVLAYGHTTLIDAQGRVVEELRDDSADLDLAVDDVRVRLSRLLRAQASPLFYGVIRSAALRRTRGFRRCIAPDIVLLAELACLGPLVRAPVDGFLQRRHPGQVSAQGDRQSAFLGTSRGVRFAFQHTRCNVELVRGIAASDLPVRDRSAGVAIAIRDWVAPRWRAMANDVRTVVAPRPVPVGGR